MFLQPPAAMFQKVLTLPYCWRRQPESPCPRAVLGLGVSSRVGEILVKGQGRGCLGGSNEGRWGTSPSNGPALEWMCGNHF